MCNPVNTSPGGRRGLDDEGRINAVVVGSTAVVPAVIGLVGGGIGGLSWVVWLKSIVRLMFHTQDDLIFKQLVIICLRSIQVFFILI